MPDEKGRTRRERNTAFGDEYSPEFSIPLIGRYLWDWYFDLSESLTRVRDGICEPIPPSEFIAWKTATGQIVYPSEYDILRAMDVAFCDEMNAEIEASRLRSKEAQEKQLAENKRKR